MVSHRPGNFCRNTKNKVNAWGSLIKSVSFCCIVAVLIHPLPGPAQTSQSADREIGRRIYEEGILGSGQPVPAIVAGDVETDGRFLSCASCHRRSGYGEGEGGSYVPPITGPSLFAEQTPDRGRLFRNLYQDVQSETATAVVHNLKSRPAYTIDSLARLLRHGIDANGLEVAAPMPRFDLDENNLRYLFTYLKTLGAEPAPGVDQEELAFATIITPDADTGEVEAMLHTLEAYFSRKNNDTRHVQARSGYSLHYKNDLLPSYRLWRLYPWRLHGPPNSWGPQLEALYQSRPVFAVVSGIGRDWRPVHKFCETRRLPCVFPNTLLPFVANISDSMERTNSTRYNLYFSKGIVGEADAAAYWLLDQARRTGATIKVEQVYRRGHMGELMARRVREVVESAAGNNRNIQIVDRSFNTPESMNRWWKIEAEQAHSGHVFAWLTDLDMHRLPRLNQDVVVASGLLSGHLQPHHNTLGRRVYATWPWTLPASVPPRIFRLRAWFRSRRIPLNHERLQLNTYFSASVVEHALTHLVDRYSREYFIESIEHETENALNPGTYPRLSLGPDQRFAAKGCYVVEITNGEFTAVTGWAK